MKAPAAALVVTTLAGVALGAGGMAWWASSQPPPVRSANPPVSLSIAPNDAATEPAAADGGAAVASPDAVAPGPELADERALTAREEAAYRVELAAVHVHFGRYTAALRLLDEAASLAADDSQRAKVLTARSRLEETRARWAEAARALRGAMGLVSDPERLREQQRRLTHLYIRGELLTDAMDLLEDRVRAAGSPDAIDVVIREVIGLHERAGLLDRLAETALKRLAEAPREEVSLRVLSLLGRTGRWRDEALTHADALLEVVGDDIHAVRAVFHLFHDAGRHERALELAERLVDLADRVGQPHERHQERFRLATLLREAERGDEADTLLQGLLDDPELSDPAQRQRARRLWYGPMAERGDLAKEVRALRRRARGGRDLDAMAALAEAYRAADRTDEQVKTLRKIVTHPGVSDGVLRLAAAGLGEAGQASEGAGALEARSQRTLMPEKAQWLRDAAQLWTRAGHTREARGAWRQLIDIDPGNRGAYEAQIAALPVVEHSPDEATAAERPEGGPPAPTGDPADPADPGITDPE